MPVNLGLTLLNQDRFTMVFTCDCKNTKRSCNHFFNQARLTTTVIMYDCKNYKQCKKCCLFPRSRPVHNGVQLRMKKKTEIETEEKHCDYFLLKNSLHQLLEKKTQKAIKQIKAWQYFFQSGMVHDGHLWRLHPLFLFNPKGLWRKSRKWKLGPDNWSCCPIKEKTHKSLKSKRVFFNCPAI